MKDKQFGPNLFLYHLFIPHPSSFIQTQLTVIAQSARIRLIIPFGACYKERLQHG